MWGIVSLVIIILTVVCILSFGTALFLIGKYNLLITRRQKLTGDLREIEFILRAEIELIKRSLNTNERNLNFSWTDKLETAEELSHQSAAQKLNENNLELLVKSDAIIKECFHQLSLEKIEVGDPIMTTGGETGSTGERLSRLFVLAREYNKQLTSASGQIIAKFMGFVRLVLPDGIKA